MVPYSESGACLDDGSQALWEDDERVFRRGSRLDADGTTRTVLLVLPAGEQLSRSVLDHFTHEYELKDQLDATWAAQPLDLLHNAGRTVLVLEDKDGEPLAKWLGAPMEVGRFLHLAIAMARAIGKAHSSGLVHKDIKPANILVSAVSGKVRLTGFGLASRLVRERHSPDPPETIAGTLPYMAPEQTGRMNRSIDSRSDLYALGVTFYQMLTGALPFAAAEPMEWVHCHLARRPVAPADRQSGAPVAVSAVIMKLLAKRAEDRYQTAAGLERDLRHCQSEWNAKRRIDDFPLGDDDAPSRLVIPERLYGRRHEVETLLAAFDRIIKGGAPELVLVSGYSGIGKSSVVNELQPVLVPPRALFASGKFDQIKRDIPYATLAQAFQALVRPLLGKSETGLAPWRVALQEALGPNAGLIADLVPELKLIIGETLPVPELPPQDAQRRFQLLFRQFIAVFARPRHPLALFLDDLQWLDAATLDLLEDLLSRSDIRNLLIIGAYRDNEVTAAHPLMRKLEAIRTTRRVQDLRLGPLTVNDLRDLISDALRCDQEQSAPLAELIHAKTDGNPLFVVQVLHVLADEGLLTFDHEQAKWTFDLAGIHAKRYTDNVVELLTEKLTRLSPDTLVALRHLACLGNVAEAATLAIVLRTSEEQLHAILLEALNQQLIERSDRSYKFVHDRVQEAAYASIPEEFRLEAHVRIGRLLLVNTTPESRDDVIFEIVNQLNRGAPLITSPPEREQLAELNLAAGIRAKRSSAYVSALTYLTDGAALLPQDAWERSQELAFELELHPADCEISTGALHAAEARLCALAKRAVGTIQRFAVASRLVDVYAMLGLGQRAVPVALDYLRHVGIDWPLHPSDEETHREYERFWSVLGSRAIEDIVTLPLMEDPEDLATVEMLAKVSSPAEYIGANLIALSICRAANLSLERGNNDAAPLSYSVMGLIATAHFGDQERGYRLGKMACDLVDRRGLIRFGARTFNRFAVVAPWTQPLTEVVDLARRAFEMAKRHGEPAYAAFSCRSLISAFLAAGHPLNLVEHEAERGKDFVLPFGFFLDRMSAPLALVRTLRGKTPNFGSLDDGYFNERSFEERTTGQSVLAFLECHYWIRKLQARFFAGDYLSAIAAAEKVGAWYSTSAPLSLLMLEKTEYQFYAALSHAALCQPTDADTYDKHRQSVAAYERELRGWDARCPQNFQARATLVSAEVARIEGRVLDAMDLYERAIAAARANGFVHDEAIACELASRFHAGRGFEDVAHLYLGNARRAYLRWGADGKVRQLDQLHPQLKHDERAPRATGTIEAPIEQLDLAAVIDVSQALSGEMVLEKLINKLMRTAIEQAGAERGLLVVPQDDELRIDAEATARGDDVAVHLPDRDGEASLLPESLVRYAIRTREAVILDDALLSQSPFSSDPYIVDRRARSVLCVPLINQGRLIGALYLENNLTPRVFTPNRITVLKVLASQAAISLENTRLYRDLADREARIRRLWESNIIGICIWDLGGPVLSANDEFLRVVKYDPADVASRRLNWLALTPDEWREGDRRAMAALCSTGTFAPFEKEYVCKDGSRVPVLVGGALFEEGSEGVAFVLDLTERKRAERALKQSETRYQNLFQAMAVSFFELDYTSSRQILRGLKEAGVQDFRSHFKENPHLIREFMRATRVVDVNDQTVALFGRGNKDELLTSVEAFWPDESLNDYLEAVLATIERNDEFSIETRVRRLDGTVFDARFTLRYATDDKTRGLAGVIDITERKRAENALRESERKFRDYAETGSDWFWEASPDARLTAVSGNAYGANSSALIGAHVASFALDRESEPEKWRELRSTVRAQKPFRDFVYLEAVEGGPPRYVKVGGKPVFDGSGEFLGYRGTTTDVTAVVSAQVALRESERRFRDYAETASDWLWEMGPDHKLTMLTGNAFGSSPSGRLGTAAWERALDLEAEPEKWRAIRATMDSHTPFRDFVYLAAGGDGSPMYVKASGKPVFGGNGEFLGYRGTGSDVTAIVRAQEALHESERSLRLIIDTIPALAWSARPDGSAEFFNQQYLAYVGLPAEQLLNWGWTVAVHPDDLNGLAATWQTLLASGKQGETAARLRRHDGEYRWFLFGTAPLRDDVGNIVKWYGFNTDIEDRSRALERVQQMQSDFAHMNRVSMMGELAATLSHEIAQPIGSARNNARAAMNFLNREPPDLSEVREALGCIVNDSDRAGNIIGRIRDQIRKAPPRKDDFDLNAAITEVIGLAQSAITRNGISVQTKLAEQLHSVHGDRVQLQQVVLNLVLNAVEAMGSVDAAARELLIITEPDHAGVRVAVRDSGPGIDPKVLDRLFEAFYTTKSSGTGMGLAICRSIIDAHGGRLWVEPNEPRGAAFRFTLPGAGTTP